jgi:hypothetical protein
VPPFRVVAGLFLLLGAAAFVAGAAAQLSRGRALATRPGVVRDARDVRRRSAAALVEASGVFVLALGLVAHQRVLVVLGAAVTAVGAVLMSFARSRPVRRG